MSHTTRQRLNAPFHRLTEEEIRQWYSDKFITTACYLLAIRRITRPPGAKFVIPNVLEFCEKWGITRSAFYRAVNELKRKGYSDWETTHGIVLKESSKVLNFPTLEESPTGAIQAQPAESRIGESESCERDFSSYERDSNSYKEDTQTPKQACSNDFKSPQIIPIIQTNQIGVALEKFVEESAPIQDEVRSLDGSSTLTQLEAEKLTSVDDEVQPSAHDSTPTKQTTSAWSSVSNCIVNSLNPGQGKTSASACDIDFHIPSDLRQKLQELQIPLDSLVLQAIASHDISKAYGAIAHIERTWSSVNNPRGVFLFQIARQPVEPMGSRLSVKTAADFGYTLEHLKKIYPNTWQDAARHFGLEVA